MADKKISQLGATTTPVNADLFAIVQSGVTKKITYQNLKAAILNSGSLTTGYIPFYNGTNLVDSYLLVDTINSSIHVKDGSYIASENELVRIDLTSGSGLSLSSQYGDGIGTIDLASESSSLTWTGDVESGSLYVQSEYSRLKHSSIIVLEAPTVRISDNLLTSGTTSKSQIYFGASGNQFDVSTDGGTNAESRIFLTPTTAGTYFGAAGYIELTNSEIRFFHDTKLLFNAPIYNFSQLTASTVPYLDASKNLVSSAITPTELGYLTGASSNLQSQIDALVTGLSWKQAVRVATTAAGTLASDFENGDTIDGVVLATGDRILIKDQASATENGIYIVNASGAPTRASDMNTGSEFPSATVAVSAGTTNADTQWVCTNDSVTIGVTNVAFVAVGGTTYVGTTGKITVTGNIINVGSNIMLLDGTTPLTANWDVGNYQVAARDFKITGTAGDGHVHLRYQSSIPTGAANNSKIFAGSTGALGWVVDSNAYAFYLDMTGNTASRTLTVPDVSGTIALQSYSYTGQFLALNPADSTNYHFNGNSIAPSATDSARAFKFGKAGTIDRVYLAYQQSTNGSNETINLYLRNVTAGTDASVGTFTSDFGGSTGSGFNFEGLSLTVNATDFYTWKIATPAFGTNPTAWIGNLMARLLY